LQSYNEHQEALNLPPIGAEVAKAAEQAQYQIAASSGRILGPSVLQVRRLVKFLDPTQRCQARQFAQCLERTNGSV